MTRTYVIAAAILAVAITGGVLHFSDADPVVTFVVTGAALGGVAWAIGIATESVGARFGPAVTGALQSTLGNLPELFIVLFALSAGEVVVAQFRSSARSSPTRCSCSASRSPPARCGGPTGR